MNKIKRYFKNHPDATIEDYNNQKHEMHIMQASKILRGKHVGSKNEKQLLSVIKRYV